MDEDVIESEVFSVETNDSGYVTQVFSENGKRRRVIMKLEAGESDEADRLIAWMMRAETDEPPPTFTPEMVVRAAFKQALTNGIVCAAADSPEIAAMKRAVLETRLELIRLVEQGQTVERALQALRPQLSRNARYRTDALLKVKSLYEQGDRTAVQQQVEAFNHAFRQLGLEPIPQPGVIESQTVELP